MLSRLGPVLALVLLSASVVLPFAVRGGNHLSVWLQWSHNSGHTSSVLVSGQTPARNLFDIEYDPLVSQEQAGSGGDLLVHYQAPLVDGKGSVYMVFKSGSFDPETTRFATESWSEKKLSFDGTQVRTDWTYNTDWIPPGSYNDFWEPVFHPAISGPFIYLPGRGGSIWRVTKDTGIADRRINPFGPAIDGNTFVVSPLTADVDANIYYTAIQLAAGGNGFLSADVVDSWLVKIDRDGVITKTSFRALLPNAPSSCLGSFAEAQLPWPPSPGAVPPSIPCGSIRAAINAAPAVGDDGTIYTVARTHRTGRYGWIVAIHPGLTLKWAASLRDRLHDGCNSPDGVLPPNGNPGGCRAGATAGVDPSTNRPGDGRVNDNSSSTITVAPDGILYGAYNRYNYSQGHLMKFDFNGNFTGAFGFGWDSTPAIYLHGRSYSIVIKNNHYTGLGPYCDDNGSGQFTAFCPPGRNTATPGSREEYLITQLGPDLEPEWSYRNTNTQSCTRNSGGAVSCVSDHPAGFEWCVNAPAVDRNGVVYANSEDGNLYAIEQGGALKQNIFQQLALGAAYTPMSIGGDGRLYSQNAGHLFVVGR